MYGSNISTQHVNIMTKDRDYPQAEGSAWHGISASGKGGAAGDSELALHLELLPELGSG